MYDLIIVGGGPAGATAAVYAARKKIKTVFITNEWGGQSSVSLDIQNWIGTPHISGADLAKNLRAHVMEYAGQSLTIVSPATVKMLSKDATGLTVTLSNGDTLTGKTLFVATGAVRRKLEVPGAQEFEHKGLTYCASCDGPLFTDMPVSVIGGGNAAFESALQLSAYCSSVTLLNRTETFRADEITVAAALANPRITILKNALISRVTGDSFVKGLVYTDSASNTEHQLEVNAIFVEIGLIPSTGWLGGLLRLDPVGHVMVNPRTQRAFDSESGSETNVWAAGDCTDGLYHQNNIAAGDAVKALEDIYIFLQKTTS